MDGSFRNFEKVGQDGLTCLIKNIFIASISNKIFLQI